MRAGFTSMTTNRAQAFVFWLLPILVLRALMPVGLMLDTSRNGVAIVMCSGDTYQGVTHTSNDNFGTSRPQTSQHDDQHSVCPFSVALAAAPTVQSTFIVDSTFASATPDARVTSPQSTYGPSRINLTRGPPWFS